MVFIKKVPRRSLGFVDDDFVESVGLELTTTGLTINLLFHDPLVVSSREFIDFCPFLLEHGRFLLNRS